MALSVYLQEVFGDDWVKKLRAKLDSNINLYYGEKMPESADYEILVAGVPEKEQIEASPNLKKLIIPWAGLSTRTRELLINYPDLEVHNLHYNSVPVAETAVALMMAAAKYIIPIDRRFRGHDWRPRYNPYPALMLKDRNALVLGYGSIGKEIARICHGLGMKVTAIKRIIDKPSDEYAKIYPPMELHNLLPEANVLFISLPMTPETRDSIGKKELGLLPDGAILVNIARGPIINEKALYDELASGRISAGLDVWYNYPKTEEDRKYCNPSDYEFHMLENVVMTPHLAERSDLSEDLNVDGLAVMLNLAAHGKPLPNKVDVLQGY
jgi:phosphoglycerate dehydrogenase-like enzyme